MNPSLPTEVHLRLGERRTVPLPSLGAAGYTWNVTTTASGGAVTATLETETIPSDPATSEPSSGGIAESLVLVGEQPGRALVELQQRRQWEADRAPLRTIVIEAIVASAN